MVTTQPTIAKDAATQRASIDTSPTTVEAFNRINQIEKKRNVIEVDNVTKAAYDNIRKMQEQVTKSGENFKKGFEYSPLHKVKVKVVTNQDGKEHTYFHSMSIDAQVTDFLHTCELRCPFHWDLMEYWEPIRQSCVVYGANQGDYKILFIGRVRELIQDGYELSITLQNYGWKFKQDVSQSYADDNVINKNGYQIMCAMFEALKIDSYVISESAKLRLKQVGIDEDGNLVANGEEIEEMPDLLERLKSSDPSKLVSKQTLESKLLEGQLKNIENINYTLKYEEKTPVMQKIESGGDYGGFSAGKSIYGEGRQWGGGGGSGGVGGSGSGGSGGRGCKAPNRPCSIVQNNGMNAAMQEVFLFNRDCTNNLPTSSVVNYARSYSSFYNSQVKPCLNTIAKHAARKDGRNGASEILNAANGVATVHSVAGNVARTVTNAWNSFSNWAMSGLNAIGNTIHSVSTGIVNTVKGWFGW